MPYKDAAKQRQVVSESVKRYRELHGNNWSQINTVTPSHITNEDIAKSINSHLEDIISTWEARKGYEFSDPAQRNSYDRCSNKIKEKRKRIERWLKVLKEQRHVTPESLGIDVAKMNEWLTRGAKK